MGLQQALLDFKVWRTNKLRETSKKKGRGEEMTIYSEVVDTPEHARAFMKLNKIKQENIRAIVILWDEKENDKR
jgi:hypothetical protein